MTDAEALDFAIGQVRASRSLSEENLYGHRYRDRTKHPDHEAIQDILAEYDEALSRLITMRDASTGL